MFKCDVVFFCLFALIVFFSQLFILNIVLHVYPLYSHLLIALCKSIYCRYFETFIPFSFALSSTPLSYCTDVHMLTLVKQCAFTFIFFSLDRHTFRHNVLTAAQKYRSQNRIQMLIFTERKRIY